MRRINLLVAVLILGALAGSGCFNGADFGNNYNNAKGNRFALVIEPGRTPIQATHYLLDTATGDTWRLDSRSGVDGQWVRLVDGPVDVTPLEMDEEGSGDDDDS